MEEDGTQQGAADAGEELAGLWWGAGGGAGGELVVCRKMGRS